MPAELPPWLFDLISTITYHAVRPVFAFRQSDSMLYAPYLASSAAIILVFAFFKSRGRIGGFLAMLGDLFSPRYWWSRSARADYRFYLVNGFLFPMIVGPVLISNIAVATWLSGGLATVFGPGGDSDGQTVAITIVYTVLFFVSYDFGRFVAHWLQHRVPLLWEFHKVHHSAESLTPITSFRAHPVDLVVMNAGGALASAPITGTFLHMAGGELAMTTVLGMHVLIFAYNLIGNLRHSHVWVGYGVLSHVFVSPAMHQIHHSINLEHRDRNCGFALSIWDRMFGTCYIPQRQESFVMGLGDGTDGQWHKVWRLYWRPVAGAARLIRGAFKAETNP